MGNIKNASFGTFALVLLAALELTSSHAYAACGITNLTWSPPGGQTSWAQSAGWGGNVPDATTENALIAAASGTPNSDLSVSIGCLEFQSGFLNTTTGITVTVNGDYFKNPNSGSLTVPAGSTWTVNMAGTAAQTFENYDTINYLTISNNTSVTFPRAFQIRNSLNLTGSGTTVYVNASLTLQNTATPLTIPTGVTVEVASGATLTALGGITVNGTLKVSPGGAIAMGSGTTLAVNSGGLLQLAGASGNVATLKRSSSGTFSVNIAGYLNANYFRVNHIGTAGFNVTGTLQRLENGEFHYLASAGYAVTLGAAAVIPAAMNALGFFDDSGFGNVGNINAASYNLTATTLNNWTGSVGGATYESDINSKIGWGTAAGVKLTLSDNTAAGSPPTTIGQSVGPTLFATFAFALSQTATATDITQIKFTLSGTATSSDVSYLRVYKDAGAGTNCVYDAAADTQLGADLTVSGSPATATLAIPAGSVTTSGTTPACVHVLVRTTSTAMTDRNLAIQIASTADVTNSQSYLFSDTSGPPVSAPSSTIVGSAVSTWNGRQNTNWNNANNWIEATVPTSTRDCKIGVGDSIAALNVNGSCQNATLQASGTLDFAAVANRELAVYGSLTVQSSFTFSQATTGLIAMRGTGNQSLNLATTFPGNLTIANTGGAGTNYVNVDTNSTVNGNLTVSSGVLRVNGGVTLTVLGSVTVASGATLDIEPGATLALGNASALTVNTGGTLELIGSAAQTAVVTSTATTNAYTVVINGTIKAQYYTFTRLGTNGVTINAAGTIDSTYHLQNGTFSYPVNNTSTFLRLYTQIPTDTMNYVNFDASGSAATGITNIYTDAGIASDGGNTLTLSNYSGSWAGAAYDNDAAAYALSWAAPTNTLDLTRDAAGPASVNQGETSVMGRYAFKQTQAGASFSDTDITSLKLTLVGTGTSSDVSAVKIYYDSGCTSTGGTLIGTGTFSGNPATVTFPIAAGAAIVPMNATTTVKRCIYVAYDVSADAVNANTLGVSIAGTTDVVNSQSYAISGSTPPPVTLGTSASVIGTTTIWTGATSTAWNTATNWNGGVPTSALNCKISSATLSPVISGPGAVCKSLTIDTGTLTMTNAAGATLDVYGSINASGTLTQNDGIITLRDNGSAITQTVYVAGGSMGALTVNQTSGSNAKVDASLTSFTLRSLTTTAGTFAVQAGQTLILTNGATVSGGTFTIPGTGEVRIGNGQSILVNGGTFSTTGTNDANPQVLTNKATVTVSGAGTWNFTATSGTVSLTGFLFNYLGNDGLNFGGTTVVSALDGGQLSYLPSAYASMKGIQFNTTGAIPATATNIAWNWGAPNSTYNAPPSPAVSDAYTLAASTGCGGQTISFDQWFGDFFFAVNEPWTPSKVSSTGCTINIAASASPVSLTSLEASGYNASVAVDWRTGSEMDHQGFNVFRSDRADGGFIQVNPSLIRNFSTSNSLAGVYRYVDNDVVNDKAYYYILEDIATNGTRTRHGPVSATPRAAAGSAPAASGGTNSGGSSTGAGTGNSPTSGTVTNGSLIDLGNGVHILARTRHSMRLEIVPPSETFAVSAWNASYETVQIPGYSSTLEAGKPELVERTVLVEVDRDLSAVTVGGSSVQEQAPSAHLIAPVPSWSVNGSGQLVPSYAPDAAAYADATFLPATYFDVGASTVQVNGRNYIQVRVFPLKYDAANQQLKRVQRIVLDLGLNGSAWSAPVPSGVGSTSPSAVEDTLRIRYRQTGVYQITYADLVSVGLEAPFSGVSVSDLRLYLQGNEIPMEVVSGDGVFGSGDAIRFYAPYTRQLDERDNEVVLSKYALAGSSGAALRIAQVNADPSLVPATDEAGTLRTSSAESDLYPMFDSPLGSGLDHLYWDRIWRMKGDPVTAGSNLTMPVDLPGLDRDSWDSVRVRLHVKGGYSYSRNAVHHVGLLINSAPFVVASKEFQTDQPTVLTFDLPHNLFIDGINDIQAQVLADKVPDGDFDLMYIDRVEVTYRAHHRAINGLAEITNYRLDHAIDVAGFSNPVSVMIYDVTHAFQVKSLTFPAPASPDGGVTYTASFAANSVDGTLGRKLYAFETAALPKPVSLSVGRGFNSALRASANSADLIVIGPSELLPWAQELINTRRSQGLRVVEAPLEQIFAEFSHGLRSARGIRDFIAHARANWIAPAPKYVLFVGDATYGRDSNLMPIALEKGLYLDFGNDNWFVSGDDGIPFMAAGRIPTQDPIQLLAYIGKILDYESSARAPAAAAAKKIIFVNDTDTMGEGFGQYADSLASTVRSSASAVSTQRIDRSIGTDAAANSAITNAFKEGPLAITYVGHGAEDRWAAGGVFHSTHASALANSRLPIVVGLNCLNSYFYDADPSYMSLGERLIFNAEGGAVAFWGSTTFTTPASQVALANAFFNQLGQEVRQTYHDVRIGDLMVQSKSVLGNSAAMVDSLKSYTLLGDPSMRLPASSFTEAAAPQPQPTAAQAQEEDGGWFFGCGRIDTNSGKGGPKGPANPMGALTELALLMMMVWGARRLSKAREVA